MLYSFVLQIADSHPLPLSLPSLDQSSTMSLNSSKKQTGKANKKKSQKSTTKLKDDLVSSISSSTTSTTTSTTTTTTTATTATNTQSDTDRDTDSNNTTLDEIELHGEGNNNDDDDDDNNNNTNLENTNNPDLRTPTTLVIETYTRDELKSTPENNGNNNENNENTTTNTNAANTCDISFFSGNPNVELTKGILHIFCDKRTSSTSTTTTTTTRTTNTNTNTNTTSATTLTTTDSSGDDICSLKKSFSNSNNNSNNNNNTTTTNATSDHQHGYSVFDESATKEVPLSGMFFGSVPAFPTTRNNTILVKIPKNRSKVVAILAVPSTLDYTDLLQFTAPVQQTIHHMRIIKDGSPNRYLALLSFASEEAAVEFYVTYNDRKFNSMEPETCHLAFVSSVSVTRKTNMEEFLYEMESKLKTASASSPDTPNSSSLVPTSTPLALTTTSTTFSNVTTSTTTTTATATATTTTQNSPYTELPTCPVCLERLDETASGIFTTICNHNFHCNCLSGWKDGSCPICRHCIQADYGNKCHKCDLTKGLWICLICAHIGCGRYDNGRHAYEHFLETQHTYAMEIESQRVWDYAGDNYVHRLIQNKSNGEMVAVHRDTRNSFKGDTNHSNNNNSSNNYSNSYEYEGYYSEKSRTKKDPNDFGFGDSGYSSSSNSNNSTNNNNGNNNNSNSNNNNNNNNNHNNNYYSHYHHHQQQFYEYSSSDEKVDSLQLEYTYLLTSQLEKQRNYYMEKMTEMENQALDNKRQLEDKINQLTEKFEEFSNKFNTLEKEKKSLEKKYVQLKERTKKLEADYNLEKELNSQMVSNKAYYQNELEETKKKFAEALKLKDARISELSDEVRDIMVYIDTQHKVSQSSQAKELQEGKIIITESPTSSATSSPNGKGKNKK